MCILVDDEARENEGDLVIPASKANADAINFMARFGRGLICLALTQQRVQELGLSLMSPHNGTRHQTAFTVSIEAKEGITTGISAADRARTIAVAIDPAKNARDIITPGHVFPLVARDGGVLVRAGHTEAAVDIARMAGLPPAGVICEIMNDDGTMARLPDLIEFAKQHQLRIATIADLISYRRRAEKMVKRLVETPFESRFGGHFHMIVYGTTLEPTEHVALVRGNINPDQPVPVRMHVLDVFGDVLGGMHNGYGGTLESAMRWIAAQDAGVVVLLRNPQPTGLADRLRAEQLPPAEPGSGLRDYGIGAQILLDLGVRKMILVTNTRRMVVGLEGYGLSIDGYQSIPPLS